MNYREIIGPDELDWKVIPLDWKKIGKEELKMGTPMSNDGAEANDASCYGILMDDVQKDKHFQARVIVSGCVDFAKAEEYSGIKISAEAKKAIGKVWSQGGGGLTELPEGYPYKERSEQVLFEQEITTNEQGVYLAGFDFIDLEIGKDYVVTFGGVDYPCTAGSVSMNPYLGNLGLINPEFSGTDPFFIMPSEGGAIVLPDFANQTVNVKISTVSETIQPMAPEFMPLLTSPNGTKYKLTVADDGTLSAVAQP